MQAFAFGACWRFMWYDKPRAVWKYPPACKNQLSRELVVVQIVAWHTNQANLFDVGLKGNLYIKMCCFLQNTILFVTQCKLNMSRCKSRHCVI